MTTGEYFWRSFSYLGEGLLTNGSQRSECKESGDAYLLSGPLPNQMTNKESTELYYKLDSLTNNLKEALKETRNEPGLSLKDISNIIKKVLDKSEIEALIKELK